ncbi:MAG: thioesterase family protein [Allobaculum sp.]|nr:thioesterase family protein [Allobaculum sp.]
MEKCCVLYRTVEAEDLAISMKSGALPVLATPRMIAWMEEASFELIPLEKGQTNVGISLDVSHDRPTALGKRVQIYSRLKSVEGRIYTFEVKAYCDGYCIGKGFHKRAVVNVDRFMEKLDL